MSKSQGCIKGSSAHVDCPEGFVYLCSVFEIGDADGFDYKETKIGFSVFDSDGELLPEQKAVFVREEEYRQSQKK